MGSMLREEHVDDLSFAIEAFNRSRRNVLKRLGEQMLTILENIIVATIIVFNLTLHFGH